MSSKFDQDFLEAGAPNQLEYFGESVSYSDDGSDKAIDAIVGEESTRYEELRDGEYLIRERHFTLYTDATTGIPDPEIEKDSITYSSEVWQVVGIDGMSDSLVRVLGRRAEPTRIHGVGQLVDR